MIILYYNESKQLKEVDKNNVMDDLYFLKASLPTDKQIKEHKQNDNIKKFFNKFGIETGINKIKKIISTVDNKVPLYDIYHENLYIISKHNVYNRVVYQYYRFPTYKVFDVIKNKKIEYNKKSQNNPDDKILLWKAKKSRLMIDFLENFNLDILYQTYMKIFYLYSNEVGKAITICKRPSFIQHYIHIKPYYSRSEIINMALNMGIKLEDRYLEEEDINKLCIKISENDITSKTLLEHQKYIIKNNKVGLVQYYSIQGSFFMNQYLRGLTPYKYKNNYLEKLIEPMWELSKNAPAFDKDYILYRFINDDSYIRELNIGDIYTEKGFMSTTRDPFYGSDKYSFGSNLIKIKIPKDVIGVGLCIETISHFPHEEEIILTPNSMFRLDNRDENINYYHTNERVSTQIKTKYEFTYIGSGKIIFPERPLLKSIPLINFLDIEKKEKLNLEDKIKYFIKNHNNEIFQYNVEIGNNIFTVVSEWYESNNNAYSKYYAINTDKGFSMYSLYDNHMLFLIEIGFQNGLPIMHVNYFLKYSTIDRELIMGRDNFLTFISSIAYYFSIPLVIIYADYKACGFHNIKQKELLSLKTGESIKLNANDSNIQRGDIITLDNQEKQVFSEYGGSFCLDLYEYFKDIKRFEKYGDGGDIRPKFYSYQIDKLKDMNPEKILNKEDQDEIYQLYEAYYLPTKGTQTIGQLFIWIAENYCHLMEIFIFKFDRIFPTKEHNPFTNDYYILDPYMYLYNNNIIKVMPKSVARLNIDIVHDVLTYDNNLINIGQTNKNRSRL